MSINTTGYHVIVPSDLTYYVEADSEEEAGAKVAAALFGIPRPLHKRLPNDTTVALLADKTTHKPPPWDVEFASACHGCGCEIDPDIHPTACAHCA